MRVVLPASGWLMMAKVRRRAASTVGRDSIDVFVVEVMSAEDSDAGPVDQSTGRSGGRTGHRTSREKCGQPGRYGPGRIDLPGQ